MDTMPGIESFKMTSYVDKLCWLTSRGELKLSSDEYNSIKVEWTSHVTGGCVITNYYYGDDRNDINVEAKAEMKAYNDIIREELFLMCNT